MTTEVILTGTGVPNPSPTCAGAGTLVRWEDVSLQVDAGRGTVLRLAQAGVQPFALTALLVTHVHSDHVVSIPDIALSRWLQQLAVDTGPLGIVAPEGPTARFILRMLDAFDEDIAVRMGHVGSGPPQVDLTAFPVPGGTTQVWTSSSGDVRVSAVRVHHEPVEGAVAYRVDTPDGGVVVSGDTRVCDEVAELSRGCDVLVHEACRTSALADRSRGTVLERIHSYHADTVALGAMAERVRVPHLVLTHLIPQLGDPGDAVQFEDDVRRGGFTGRVTVGTDLARVSFGR